MGYGHGTDAGSWIALTIFWLALLTLLVWSLSRSRGAGTSTSTAEDIVDRRFAAGEVDEDTYHSMRAALRSPRAGRPGTR